MGKYGQEPKSADEVERILRAALFEVENFMDQTWREARRIEAEAFDDLQEEPTIGNAKTLANLARFEQRTSKQREDLWQQCHRLKHDFGAFTQMDEAIRLHEEERTQRKNGTLATKVAVED